MAKGLAELVFAKNFKILKRLSRKELEQLQSEDVVGYLGMVQTLNEYFIFLSLK